MPRVEHQLREYFDAGVERISIEDVIAQAEVREARLEPLKTQWNLRPAWAAVGAFAATIVALGGLAAVLTVTQRLTGELGSETADIVQADGGTVGLWLVAGLVAALAAAVVTWMMRRPTRQEQPEDEDQGKVTVMETIEDTKVDTTKEPGASSRWPIALVVVLAIAVVGLIAWMTLAMHPNSPNAAPPEIAELMEQYNAAFNAYDFDALEDVVTPFYRIHSPMIDFDIEGLRTVLMPQMVAWDWKATSGGPYYAGPAIASENGGLTWYVSSEGVAITRDGVDHPQQGVWTVVQVNGELLVAEHFFMGG